MAQAELVARKRDQTGKGPAGRLRRSGWVPAVIYGRGRPSEPLMVERRRLDRILDSGAHMVSVLGEDEGEARQVGSGSGGAGRKAARRALIREVQVHPVTQEVLHVDFMEVAEHDLVEISVRVVLRGEPVGVKDGGVLDFVLHEVQIECPASAVIDELRVDVSHVELGGALHVEDFPLPEGARSITPGNQLVVSVRKPREVVEEEVAPADTEVPAEPEVIGEKREDEEKEQGKK